MWSRAVFAVLVAVVCAAPAFASGDEVACAREANSSAAIPNDDLRSLFAAPADVTVTAAGMSVIAAPNPTVILIRRAEDGSLDTICVTSAEAAEAFLHPKAAPVSSRKAQEK